MGTVILWAGFHQRGGIAKCELIKRSGSWVCKNFAKNITREEAPGSASATNGNNSSCEPTCLVRCYQANNRGLKSL